VKLGPNMGKPETKAKGKAKSSAPPPPPTRAEGTSKASKSSAAKAAAAADGRRPGGRGAAPWAARHAAKHAEEARARNAEPPRPGSARATLRTPEEADQIKARVGELSTAVIKIRGLRKHLGTNFYEIGRVLQHIQDTRLYDAKGYASFDAFVEREIDLGKAMALKLVRIPVLFQQPAIELGLEALAAALNAIDEVTGAITPSPATPAPGGGRQALPMKPPRSNNRN